MTRPTPAEFIAARKAAGHTQADVARLVYAGLRTVNRWESGEILMPPAEWALYRLRTGQTTIEQLEPA